MFEKDVIKNFWKPCAVAFMFTAQFVIFMFLLSSMVYPFSNAVHFALSNFIGYLFGLYSMYLLKDSFE
jgi:hypothetical protein